MNKYSKHNRGVKLDKANKADMDDKMEATPIKPEASLRPEQAGPPPGGKVKWPTQVKAAKSQWGKLSEAEILKSDGDQQQLSTLVQQRYHIDRHLADKQVKTFLDQCNLA